MLSRRRYISTDISIDRAVNRMGMEHGDFSVLLYTWMIPHALDDATLTGDPFEILNMVFPGRRDKTEEDIITALEAMVKYGLIEWRDSRVLFHPDSFYKYQTYIKKENRRTAQNAEEHRKTPNISDERRESAQNTVSLSLSPSLTHSLPPSHSKDSGGDHASPTELEVRIQRAYEQALSTIPSEVQVSRLSYWCDTKGMEEALVLSAIQNAGEKTKGLDYIVGILRNQYERGIRTVAQAQLDDMQHQTAAGGERSGGHQRNSTKTTGPVNEYRKDKPGAY